jgi:hypothetical protein
MSIRISRLLVLYTCLTACLINNACFPEKTETGKNAAGVDWLPSSATQITFRKKSGRLWEINYECGLPQKDFEKFAAENKWPIKPEKDYYTSFRRSLELPPLRETDIGRFDIYPRALVYRNSKRTGWCIEVIYDPDRQVLFVHENSD